MRPSALAASEVTCPCRTGTGSGVSPATVPRADSVSAYNRVGMDSEPENFGAAATMKRPVSPAAATAPHSAPCHGKATVVTTCPVAADSTCRLAPALLLYVTTTWNRG